MVKQLFYFLIIPSVVVVLFFFLGQSLAQQCQSRQQVCENHIEDNACRTVFGANLPGQKRPKRCESPYLQTEALQCAKHCRLCCERPEHSCADKIDGEQCQKFRLNQSCWKTTFPSKKQRRKHTKMVNQCAGTCGICSRRKEWNEETMCRDQQWACSDMAPLCALDARVRRICPKTCEQQLKKLNIGNSTDSDADYESPCQEQKSLHEFVFKQPEEDEDCIDTRADCRKDMFFCEMPNYFLKLANECPLTCAYCKPKGHKCKDRDAKKCAQWQAHRHRPFCQSRHFSKGVKFHWCPKMCGLC